jgi:mRNA-degrading endonuclease RelE of RelBE toxin-antitoxin system
LPDWKVTVDGPARRDLEALPAKYSFVVIHLLSLLAENPKRLGRPLRFELEGNWSARRGPYRVIYAIDESAREVIVRKVGHRSDVYRRT